MNSTLSKIISVLVSILILSYVAYQAVNYLYVPYETVIVKKEKYIQEVSLDGFFLRDEQVIDKSASGVIKYRYDNAQKISKATVIADVYNSERDLYNFDRIEELEAKKKILVSANENRNVYNLKNDYLNNNINSLNAKLVNLVAKGDLSGLDSIYDDMLLNYNKLMLNTDGGYSLDGKITEIQAEIDSLTAQIPTVTEKITSDVSGYFSNAVDGYEGIFTMDFLENLNVAAVEKYTDNHNIEKSNKIGKIQQNYKWFYVATIDDKMSQTFYKGKNVTMTLTSKNGKELSATVDRVVEDKSSDKDIVVLTSALFDEDVSSLRFEKVNILINEYSGVLIPKEAIRFNTIKETVVNEETGEKSVVEKEVKGVYTLVDKTVRFKQVDIVYEDSYYVISDDDNNAKYVSVYDKVIVKGNDLNDSAN